MRCTAYLLWVLILGLYGQATAQTLPAMQANYSAQEKRIIAGLTETALVRRSGAWERREAIQDGIASILVIRPDRAKAWLFQARPDWVMELAGDDPDLGPALDRLGQLPARPFETVSLLGETVVRYRVEGQFKGAPDQGWQEFHGDVWSTADGIYLRIQGTALIDDRQVDLAIELSKLQRQPQDPTLFEPPAGVPPMTLDPLSGRLPKQSPPPRS